MLEGEVFVFIRCKYLAHNFKAVDYTVVGVINLSFYNSTLTMIIGRGEVGTV